MSTLPPRPLLSGSLVASGPRRFHTKRLAPASLVGCGSSSFPAGGSGVGGGSSPPPPVGDGTDGSAAATSLLLVNDRITRPSPSRNARTRSAAGTSRNQ